MFENKYQSLADFAEDEFEVLVEVLSGTMTWAEYFEDMDTPPEWLIELSGRLSIEYLYSVDVDGQGSLSLGWIKDGKSNEYWIFSTYADGVCQGERLDIADKTPTPDEAWEATRADLEETGDACLYGELWCHPSWVPRERIVPFLNEMLTREGMDRLQGGDGPSVEEWADAIYGKDGMTQELLTGRTRLA
jgi:hypothetical protein